MMSCLNGLRLALSMRRRLFFEELVVDTVEVGVTDVVTTFSPVHLLCPASFLIHKKIY